jgi:hypothetical protein
VINASLSTTLLRLHRTGILLALVDQQQSPSSINATTTLRAKSNLNVTRHAGRLGTVLDPVVEFRESVLTAARNGNLPEVARMLSIIDDAEKDAA